MTTNKLVGSICILAGVLLAAAALLLLQNNRKEDAAAGAAAASVVQQLQTTAPAAVPTAQPDAAGETTVPAETINGYDYIGVLEIPALNLTLPIMADWDYDRLKIAPCRQFGSVETDDLVIAGHNYKTHFGYLDQLQVGDAVNFTDVNGKVTVYHVELTSILQPDDVDAVQNSGYPLVLYSCTYSGKTRLTVFCKKV